MATRSHPYRTPMHISPSLTLARRSMSDSHGTSPLTLGRFMVAWLIFACEDVWLPRPYQHFPLHLSHGAQYGSRVVCPSICSNRFYARMAETRLRGRSLTAPLSALFLHLSNGAQYKSGVVRSPFSFMKFLFFIL
jgi:hypothetical protein